MAIGASRALTFTGDDPPSRDLCSSALRTARTHFAGERGLFSGSSGARSTPPAGYFDATTKAVFPPQAQDLQLQEGECAASRSCISCPHRTNIAVGRAPACDQCCTMLVQPAPQRNSKSKAYFQRPVVSDDELLRPTVRLVTPARPMDCDTPFGGPWHDAIGNSGLARGS